MKDATNNPNKKGPNTRQSTYTNMPDQTPRREGGDDALAERSAPDDARADEKVIVNEQRENKIVNRPSQTAANGSERFASDEEIVNE